MAYLKISMTELKAHLGLYIKRAEQGDVIIITSRGKTVAQLTTTKDALMERVKILQKAGLVKWNGKKLKIRDPVMVNNSGKQFSDIVVEMREESF